jgi:hypothetical protein
VIAFAESSRKTGRDILLLAAADQKASPLIDAPGDQAEPRFSPNGDWLAYVTNDNGYELLLRPLKGGERVRPVSSGGGFAPRWRSATELFYISGEGNAVMSVSTQWGATLTLGKPAKVFDIGAPTAFRSVGGNRVFDVTRDGQKFLIGLPIADSGSEITVVTNWTTMLGR